MRLRHVYGMLSADAVRCTLLVSPSQQRETLLQVGGLSVINAIAGAYSENLPVICIVGEQGIQSTCCLTTDFAPQSLNHFVSWQGVQTLMTLAPTASCITQSGSQTSTKK